MVTMNDIIAFIERAMKENFNIKTFIRDYDKLFQEDTIEIYNNDGECLIFRTYSDINNNNNIKIIKAYSNNVNIEISDMDIALFKVEVLKAQEYSKNKVIEYFNNFFEKDSSKLTTINDLDNEDD